MQRRPLIVGNWKMNLSMARARSLARGLGRSLAGETFEVEVGVCPTFVHLSEVAHLLEGSSVRVGAQDCVAQSPGAVTGGVCASQLRELGMKWVLVGHSERRAIFGEGDDLLAAKLGAAVDAGLEVILCVGETEEQRRRGETEAVVVGQLRGALRDGPSQSPQALTLAYEPVWAIGTGRNASAADVAEVHATLRNAVAEVFDPDTAASLRILYGGSVKPSNITEYMEIEDVDGALVGGASLEVESFLGILRGV